MSMKLDEVDRELARAENDALSGGSPQPQHRRASNEVERVVSASSVLTTSTSDAAGLSYRPVSMNRVPTSRDLERCPTELSRIHTALSQHGSTVGRGPNSRKRDSEKPLPAFGAGKPLPPQLPDREAYVVEFDGPDDPYHPQNWPFKKK